MIQSIRDKIEKLYLKDSCFVSLKDEVITVGDVIYFFIVAGTVCALVDSGKIYHLEQGLHELEKMFRGLFVRTYRDYLVNIDKIAGISRRYPPPQEGETALLDRQRDECELHLTGMEKTIPVTGTYAKRVKKALNISNFHHLVPDHPDDRRLRQLELTDFGWRELYKLDPQDTQAVEVFRKKWDIKQFDRKTMLKHFRQVGENQIKKRRVIKNIIYQLYRWMKKGIEPLSDGNIRSLWYRIKAVLAYHSDILDPEDVDVFYDVLTEMIEESQLFRYKDFGFMDVNEPYRRIGEERPDVILASEKIGHYNFIHDLAGEVGSSFICLRGEPAHISLEYFSDDLFETVGDRRKSVFIISDINPAGYSIAGNLVEGLKRHGHQFKKVLPLVDLSIFTDDQIGYSRCPVVRYEEAAGGELIPIPPANAGQITKARDWFFNVIQDDRLFSSRIVGGRKIYTIWGIESDAASREIIKRRFLDNLSAERHNR